MLTLTPMTELIIKAINFAAIAHRDQMYNNKPFFVHPWQTAQILSSFSDDENLIVAAFLHDTIEDAGITYEKLVEEFNEDVANLVREVTKDGYNSFPYLKTQRGVMLKFADRLANVSNMGDWSEERKQKYLFEKSKFWK